MDEEFLPIDDYGVIGNDNRCALVGRNGSIDWCPFPHLESPSVFAAILDAEDGGRFAVKPTGEYDASHAYVDRTNVLETTFETGEGTATVTDFMPVREDERRGISETGDGATDGDGDEDEDADDMTDERFQQAIYRKVEVTDGAVELQVTFEPRFDYARATTSLERRDGTVLALEDDSVGDGPDCEGSDSGDGGGEGDDGDGEDDGDEGDEERDDSKPADERTDGREPGRLALHADVDLEIDADESVATGTVTLEEGDTCWFHLQYGDADRQFDGDDRDEYEALLEATIDYWRTWLESCEESATELFDYEEEWRDALVRSTLVLKLLIHDESGSIPAAATTSLPEEMGGELNWDYRYNWIRDAKFTIQALHSVGQSEEAHRYFEWFRDIGHDTPEEIQPLYGLHGETNLEEECLEHLSGYRESTPVRIGNAAAGQEQLDIYGTIVQGIYETIRYENGLTDRDWESICALADYVCEHWDEEDKSLWEFRDLHEHFVHAKLLCWVALDRAIRLAGQYERDAPIDRWETTRSTIRDSIEERGYNEDKESFVQFFGADDALDATALLIPLYDFLPADDDRVQNTIDTIMDELTTEDGLVFRFGNSPARPREPGGFVLCSFWLVDALVLSGRLEEATEIFESLLEQTSDLGLLSEMIHAEDGTFLGNVPQAFSHIGLINSAIYLASASDAGEFPPAELEGGAAAPLFKRHGSE